MAFPLIFFLQSRIKTSERSHKKKLHLILYFNEIYYYIDNLFIYYFNSCNVHYNFEYKINSEFK